MKNQKIFWHLNTPFLFYVNMKTVDVNNLIKGIFNLTMQFAYSLCIALYALLSAAQQWNFQGFFYYELVSLLCLKTKRNL